jgi:hypothetical protein
MSTMAKSLGEWTTREHRDSAKIDLVFHSGRLPDLAKKKGEASEFISRLQRRMGAPVTHVNHHYWVSGVQHWLKTRINGPTITMPAEISGGRMQYWLAKYARFLWWLRATPPDVPLRLYDWQDFRHVRKWLVSRGRTPRRSILLICPKASHMGEALRKDPRFEVFNPPDGRFELPRLSKKYRHVLCHFHGTALYQPNRLMDSLLRVLAPGGEAGLLFGELRREPATFNLHQPLRVFLNETIRSYRNRIEWKIATVNGSPQRFLGLVQNKFIEMFFEDMIRRRIGWLLVSPPAVTMLALVISAMNILRLDRILPYRSDFRSAAFLRCRKIQ